MKTIKIFLVTVLIVGVRSYACALEGASTPAAYSMDLRSSSMTLHEMIGNLRAGLDSKDKRKVAGYLAAKTPKTTAEVKELFDFIVETDSQNDGGNSLSRYAVEALSKTTDASLMGEVSKRVKKGSLNERRAAIIMAAKFKYKDAVPDLITIVNEDVDKNVKTKSEFNKGYLQLTAFAALGAIGDDRAIPVMLKKLGKMEHSEGPVIAKFGYKVLPQLIEVAKNSKDESEKEEAYNSIAGIKDAASVPMLWQSLQSEKDSKLRGACAGALIGVLNDSTKPDYKTFSAYLYKEGQADSEMEYYALVSAFRKKDVAFMTGSLNTANSSNKIRAIRFLGELKAQSAIPALEIALKDTNDEVKATAEEALKKITGVTPRGK